MVAREVLSRIALLKRRLQELRGREPSSVGLIGIQALEQELARLARELPPEWSLSFECSPKVA